VFAFGVACAVLIVGGFLVVMGSIGFFSSRNEAGDLGFQAIILFANYPVDVFSGMTRVFLYGVVPAGFVSSVPAKLIDDFRLGWAVAVLGVAVGISIGAWAVFTVGLRRYTSGAVWVSA
jgi:ABC-2 type transport system permease protein